MAAYSSVKVHSERLIVLYLPTPKSELQTSPQTAAITLLKFAVTIGVVVLLETGNAEPYFPPSWRKIDGSEIGHPIKSIKVLCLLQMVKEYVLWWLLKSFVTLVLYKHADWFHGPQPQAGFYYSSSNSPENRRPPFTNIPYNEPCWNSKIALWFCSSS